MSNESTVINAANKYGFNLEFKTKDKFEENGFITRHNILMRLGDSLLEVDLIASAYTDRHFIIECKGTDSSSSLILVKESDGQDNVASMMRHCISGTNFRLIGYESSSFCSFTGDFFHYNGKELKKASRNDDDNNFYKAQLQIIDAICAFAQNESKNISHIIPVIVTNANIWVVDYNKPEKTDTTPCKWVLHKVKLDNKLKLEPAYEEADVLSFVLPVVNIHYLDEFIKNTKNMNTSTGRIKVGSLPL